MATQIQTTAGEVLKAAEATLAAIQAEYDKRFSEWKVRYDARQSEIAQVEEENRQARSYARARYGRELNAWNELPWWRRLFTLKPIYIEPAPRSHYDFIVDSRIDFAKPYLWEYRGHAIATELVDALKTLPPETLVMLDVEHAALIGLGATTESDEEAK